MNLSPTIAGVGIIVGCVGLLLIAIGSVASRYIPELRGWIGEHRVRRLIREAGLPSLHNLYATNEEGVPTQIDHLIKLPDGIAVVETKNFRGSIYGRPYDKTWTYVMAHIGGNSRILFGKITAISPRSAQCTQRQPSLTWSVLSAGGFHGGCRTIASRQASYLASRSIA